VSCASCGEPECDEGDSVLRIGAGSGAVRRGRLAGQGPRQGGDTALQEGYWTGRSSLNFSRDFSAFPLVLVPLLVYI
jgi:hypothetical protein